MNSKSTFYLIIILMVLVSGYAGYRLLFQSNDSTSKTQTSKETEKQVKANSGMRFSNSVQKTESVWSDPRLKKGLSQDISGLKISADIENNLKSLTTLYDQGADDEFLRKLKDLITQNPNVKEYAALLGDFYYNDGNWKEAETAVKRLIELDPQNAFAKTSLGEILAIQGRYDDGLEVNQQVLKTDPKNVDAMYGMMSIADMKGNADSGIKAVEEIYKNDPTNGNAAAVLADSMFSRNNLSEASKILHEGIKQDPNNSLLLKTGARIAARQGNFSEAAEWSENAATQAKDSTQRIEALNIGWQARVELKDFDGAEKAIRRILEEQPGNESAIQALQTVNILRNNKGS
ncbi:MAG: hypothetical protein JWQ35_1876 [Bacteriovoracaceae bacterium]|nr:hypothetical protein [Bacteriovoracaceae bacterium]